MTTCSRCQRLLSDEQPVRLPDGLTYCTPCCESMATDAFEMETGEPFVRWIEKHPKLTMRYQPMEMSVRRMGFVFPLCIALGGVILAFLCYLRFYPTDYFSKYVVSILARQRMAPMSPLSLAFPIEYLAAFLACAAVLAGSIFFVMKRDEGPGTGVAKLLTGVLAFLLPVAAAVGIWKFGGAAAAVVVGFFSAAFFGALALRGLSALVRAKDFELTLEDGQFRLRHSGRVVEFRADEIERACVVRPGTVGATEGALGFKNGSMLTLDTCLSDLHALGVVMDLRFREDFPPSPDDIAKIRRTKLRKIRGLAD